MIDWAATVENLGIWTISIVFVIAAGTLGVSIVKLIQARIKKDQSKIGKWKKWLFISVITLIVMLVIWSLVLFTPTGGGNVTVG